MGKTDHNYKPKPSDIFRGHINEIIKKYLYSPMSFAGGKAQKTISGTSKGFWGTSISMYTLPTFTRKAIKRETRPQNNSLGDSNGNLNGNLEFKTYFLGFGLGLIANAYVLYHTISEAAQNNYVPLTLLGASNLGSEIHERFGQQIEESFSDFGTFLTSKLPMVAKISSEEWLQAVIKSFI